MADSSVGHVVGVLTSPEKTFTSLRERPVWVVALIVLVLVGTLTNWLMSQRVDAEEMVRTSIEQRGQDLNEDQIQKAIDFQERFGPAMFVGGALIFAPLAYLVIALVCWVAFKLVGGEWSYKQSFTTALHAMMPWAVAFLLTIPIVLSRSHITAAELQGGGVLPSSLAAVAPEDASPVMKALLGSVDLFSLWTLFLLATGASVVARVSRGTAIGTSVALWVVWILVKVGWIALWT